MATLRAMAVVIGVVADTLGSGVRGGAKPTLYHARQPSLRYGAILVRAGHGVGAANERIRSVVHEVDPALPITSLAPLKDDVADELNTDRVLARLSALVALFAALLAASGIVSVISQLVTERTRDFGIRTALGASSADVLRNVLGGAAAQSSIGVLLGLALYWGSSRWLEQRLFGLSPLDPFTIAAAVGAMVGVAGVAALVPAWAATRIDPVVALRAE